VLTLVTIVNINERVNTEKVVIMKLHIEEAAEYLGVSPRTMANWRSSGEGPKFHKPTEKLVYYFKDDLDWWIRARGEGKSEA